MLCPGVTLGQISTTGVSAHVGTIRALESDGVEEQYVFYPELQLNGQFLFPSFRWSTYWGYWDDAINDVRVVDAIVYSTRGHIIGGRIAFVPSLAAEHWPLPITIFAGLAHHFVSVRYVGGEDFAGTRGNDGTRTSNTFEIGLSGFVNISDFMQFRAEAHQFFGLSDDPRAHSHKGRRAFTIGLGITL